MNQLSKVRVLPSLEPKFPNQPYHEFHFDLNSMINVCYDELVLSADESFSKLIYDQILSAAELINHVFGK